MANENMIKFLRGNVANLPQTATAGTLYFTKDEGVYLGLEDGSYHRYGDFITVADVNALPTSGAHATCMYYCTKENILARYDSEKGWIQINKQPTAEELKTLLGLDNFATKAYVGDIPNGEDGNPMAASVIAYINKKTDGIATSGNLEALGNRVSTAEGEIDTLQGDVAAINNEETGVLAQAKSYVDEEDIFVTDMKTINALGGIAANSDLNNLTTHEILKKLLYPYVDATVGNATASPNGGTYEKGATKTITSVSISVTKKSEPITSVALYNGSTLIEEKTGDAVKNGGTFTFSNLSVVVPTNGNQLTVKVTYPDANGNAKTVEKKTTALTFVYPYYMGTCAAGTAIDETLVESLTKKIESKGNKSNSFTVSDGHMVFAYPKAHGVLKSILDPNNFETIGNYTRSEVSVTGLDGTAQTYYVYTSGATTVSGFTVNFKY
ncbi:MAG: hypothetical protein UH850_11190 [Paludibacteraceae bacterium]|nr:hypothetical protein [Paludibacteraceae bacterium]